MRERRLLPLHIRPVTRALHGLVALVLLTVACIPVAGPGTSATRISRPAEEPVQTEGVTPTPSDSTTPAAEIPVAPPGNAKSPYRAVGSKLVDAHEREVRITGVNWFGLETGTFAPHGLWARNWEEMLDEIAAVGFNTIRLPYSNQLFASTSTPNGIDFNKNPDLQGLGGLELMDRIIEGAGRRGLKVILDRHRPTVEAQSELWYTAAVPEEQWINDWIMLARRYRDTHVVVGADLHNEPRGPATWGTGDPKTDWRLAAERAGNAILEANPDWLIIVEGVEVHANRWYWWGGNLMGARAHPVRLSQPERLVYSAHDYGPGVHRQKWFTEPDFPHNLPGLWADHWAYLQLEGIAPVLVGEFGGRSMGQDEEGVWQRTLVAYLREHGFHYTYWSWNANSADTGGVLKDDWQAVDPAKVGILSAYGWPRLGAPDPQRPSGIPDVLAAGSPARDLMVEAPKPESDGGAGHWTAPAAPRPLVPLAPGSVASAPVPPAPVPPVPVADGRFAVGGPFDPDIQHALQGIGGPNDPDDAHRRARERDERRYLEQVGKPWEHAVYVTGVSSGENGGR